MAFTYSKLAETTVGAGGTSAITFSNIPQNYTDLIIYASTRDTTSSTNADLLLTFNGSSVSYTNRNLYGTGSSTGSNSPFTDKIYGGSLNGNTSTASTFSNNSIYIPNYTSSTNKSVSVDAVQETNASQAFMNFIAGLWSNTTAISSISLFATSGTLMQYSTATLYGIRVEL